MKLKKRDLKNIFILFKFLLKKKSYLKIKSVKKIKAITFRKFAPEGGVGGGSAALSMMKIVIGDSILNLPIEYVFEEDNKYSLDRRNEIWDLWGAVEFAIQKTKNDKDCIYITHDYGTGFGLYLLGKKYIMVSHIQGSRVEEKNNFGDKFSSITANIIKFAEKMAFKHAYKVFTPSYGAYKYFCNSKYKSINSNEFNYGGVIYNTLWAYPNEKKIDNFTVPDNYLTFLSIGQLTVAKGMDRVPKFLKTLLDNTNQNIFFIFIGWGPLKNEIISELDKLKASHKNFDYKYFESGLLNEEIAYLQNISAVYVMLHRISIFDLATLEMMNKSKAIVLSDAGGNPEFNLENNMSTNRFTNPVSLHFLS